MKKYLLILLILASCSKNKDDNSTPGQTNTDKIINKKWAVSAVSGKDENGTLIPDWYSDFEDYEKDDYYYFKSDLTWSNEANTLKEPGHTEEKFDFGTWTLTNGDQYLQLISTMPLPPTQTITYWPLKILELTSSKMKWESIDPDGGGAIVWITFKVIP